MVRLTEKNFSYKCPMNWSEMEASANGRFCSQCQKEVFDLTNCSIDQVRALQQKHGSICGSIRLMGAAAVVASLSMAACKEKVSEPDTGKKEEIPKEQVASVPTESEQAEPPQKRDATIPVDPVIENPPIMMGVICVPPEMQPRPLPPSDQTPREDR